MKHLYDPFFERNGFFPIQDDLALLEKAHNRLMVFHDFKFALDAGQKNAPSLALIECPRRSQDGCFHYSSILTVGP